MKIDPDSPYSVSLAFATASASSSKGMTATTGPKTSSRQIRVAGSSTVTTDGGSQKPGPPGADPANATSTSSRYSDTDAFWPAEINGPISLDSSLGSRTRSPSTAGWSLLRNSS